MIKGIHIVTSRRQGKPVRYYVYAWRGGPQIWTKIGGEKPKSLPPEAIESYHNARQAARQAAQHTISWLAQDWRQSPTWAGYAAETRRMWGNRLGAIERKWGSVPLALFDDRRMRPKIIAWRNSMAPTPRTADYHITVLSSLLAHGQELGLLDHNRAACIKALYKGGNRAAIIWEADEIAIWQTAAPQVVDAINLARFSGLRRTDLVALPINACGEHAIVWETSKSRGSRIVTVPMIPRLASLVRELKTRQRAPGIETLLVNSRRRSWSPDGLNSSYTAERSRLKLPSKHLHDFRGTYATELMLIGMTDKEIGDQLGWAPTRVADIRRLYVDQARTVVAMGEKLMATVKQGVKH